MKPSCDGCQRMQIAAEALGPHQCWPDDWQLQQLAAELPPLPQEALQLCCAGAHLQQGAIISEHCRLARGASESLQALIVQLMWWGGM